MHSRPRPTVDGRRLREAVRAAVESVPHVAGGYARVEVPAAGPGALEWLATVPEGSRTYWESRRRHLAIAAGGVVAEARCTAAHDLAEFVNALPAVATAFVTGRFATGAPSPEWAPFGTVHAVLSGDDEDPDLCYDEAATRATTVAGEIALAVLTEAIRLRCDGIRLGHGDLAIVDNRVTMHGRSPFTPRYDGRDRWLQRTFAFSDLRRSRALRPGDGAVLTS